MNFVRLIVGRLLDAILFACRGENPWPAIVVVSLVLAVVVLLIFRASSNRTAIRRRRDRLLARVMELVLFQHDIIVNLGAFGRVLVANAQYLATLFVPLCLSLLPVGLLLLEAHGWFARRPLRIGETTLVTARLSPLAANRMLETTLATSPGVKIDAVPVRAIALGEVSWRLRATADGDGWAEVRCDDRTVRKSIGVGDNVAPVSEERLGAGLWNGLAATREEALPADSPVAQVKVAYPERELRLAGRHVHWLLAVFVLTMLFGLLLKKPLGVEL